MFRFVRLAVGVVEVGSLGWDFCWIACVGKMSLILEFEDLSSWFSVIALHDG